MILYGASGHCKVVVDILEAIGKEIDFIVDDNPSLTNLLGYEVRRSIGTYDEAIIAIGSGSIRKKIVEQLQVQRYFTAIHPSAIISHHTAIGEGSVVMQGAIVQSCASIGKHCIINTGASVDHDCCIADFVHIAPHATLSGNVQVGEGSWIGVGAVVKQGIKIGLHCMIGAGAVVVNDIPDGVIAVGVPAKDIKLQQYNKEMTMDSHISNGGGILTLKFLTLHNQRGKGYAA